MVIHSDRPNSVPVLELVGMEEKYISIHTRRRNQRTGDRRAAALLGRLFYFPKIFKNSLSLKTLTLNSFALSSLEPGLSPATR